MAGKRKRYDRYNPVFVFTEPVYQTTLEDAIRENQERIREWEIRQRLRNCEYKTRTGKAGRMLEAEIILSFLDRKDYTRALKQQKTGAAQKKQNDKNAQRKFVRQVHSNFTVGDISFGGGFTDENQPRSLEECHRFLARFFNVLKYHARKAGETEIKYIYVIESKEREDGSTHYHTHMILSRNAGANTARRCPKCGRVFPAGGPAVCPGLPVPARANKPQLLEIGRKHGVRGLSGEMTNKDIREAIAKATACGGKPVPIDARDWIESQWKGGDYANTRSLQWRRDGGFTGISEYFTKQFDTLSETERPGQRRWGHSQNLKEYTRQPTESYSRFTRRRVANLLKAPATMKEVFEKEYPGYAYLEEYPCEVRYSDVVDGYYLYCRMYQKE